MRVLIIGLLSQDGYFLSEILLKRGFEIFGTTRRPLGSRISNSVPSEINLLHLADFSEASLHGILQDVRPDHIYLLGAESSVGRSFDFPSETINSANLLLTSVLENMRKHFKSVRLFFAGSSECFGVYDGYANSDYPFNPLSPYAISKCSGMHLIRLYRAAYGLYCVIGILFNHESSQRKKGFVSRKVIEHAISCHENNKVERLKLANVEVIRDWGLASEYSEAIFLMLQQDTPKDSVICTGVSFSLRTFIETAYSYFNLDYRECIEVDSTRGRPTEILANYGDNSEALLKLGWQAKTRGRTVVEKLVGDYLR